MYLCTVICYTVLLHCHVMLLLDSAKLYCPYTQSLYTFSIHCYRTLHVDRYCYVHTVTRKKSCYIVTRHCHSCTFIRHCHWHTVSDTDSIDIVFEAVLTHSVAYTYAKSYPKVCCVVLSQSVTVTRRASVIVRIFFFKKSMLEQVCKLVLCLVQ